MTHNQDVWFIMNFHSGTLTGAQKAGIVEEINRYPSVKIKYSEYAKHASELAQMAINQNIRKVVAVGGDGTINEVGAILRGSNIQMGIIPIGSGNGLARHLKIPLEPMKAILKVFQGVEFEIDSCTINDIPYFCTAGVGFDAQVAYDFSFKKTRGFLTYIITSIQSYFSYKPAEYELNFEGKTLNQKAFAITFANASQYGNDAVVAPESEINDGLIDMVILRPFSMFWSIFIAIRLFTNTFSKSKFVQTVKTKEIHIKTKGNAIIHFDGEPMQLNTNELIVKIDEKKLKIIV